MNELVLYMREGDRIVEAPAEDIETARRYPDFADKGEAQGGYRLTILSRKTAYRVGEDVRVIHICEALTSGTVLYVMGPKRVYGERIDDRLVGDPAPSTADPLSPAEPYNGRVVPGPGLDANYEVTRHRFVTAGLHTIRWTLGDRASNILRIDIRA